MPQSTQFPSDLHAPPDWVRQVEGKTVASASWQDGSYGNDAAPSWILVDDGGTGTHRRSTTRQPTPSDSRNGLGRALRGSLHHPRRGDGCQLRSDARGIFDRGFGGSTIAGLSPTDTLRAALGTVGACRGSRSRHTRSSRTRPVARSAKRARKRGQSRGVTRTPAPAASSHKWRVGRRVAPCSRRCPKRSGLESPRHDSRATAR